MGTTQGSMREFQEEAALLTKSASLRITIEKC
jgi:hypothetical protein